MLIAQWKEIHMSEVWVVHLRVSQVIVTRPAIQTVLMRLAV